MKRPTTPIGSRRRARRFAPALVLVAGALALFPGFAGSPAIAAGVGDCNPDAVWPTNRQDYADQVVQLVNQHRASLGLVQLKVSPTLTGSAVWKARHMAYYWYMQHDDPAPPISRTWYQRVEACGYTGSGKAENIAYGYTSPQAVMNAWLSSPGHRANIENSSFRAIGVGSAGASTIFWAQNFGTVADGSTTTSDTTAPSAPTNLNGSATSSTKVSLTWTASTDNVGVAGYRVVRDGVQIGTTTSTSYVDSGVTGGKTYTYTVRAYDAAGNVSVASTARSVTTPASTSPSSGSYTSFPYGVTVSTGSLRAGDASRLAAQDGVTFDVNASTYYGAASWYGRMKASNSITKLTVKYVGSASLACTQTTWMYNWSGGYWVGLDSRSASTTPTTVSIVASGTLASYVSGTSGDGDVAIRIRCTRSDSTAFYVRGDLLSITYEKP